jgi:hypothetical protein
VTRAELAGVLERLRGVYGRALPVNEQTVDAWHGALGPHDAARVALACSVWIREQSMPPRPADLVELARASLRRSQGTDRALGEPRPAENVAARLGRLLAAATAEREHARASLSTEDYIAWAETRRVLHGGRGAPLSPETHYVSPSGYVIRGRPRPLPGRAPRRAIPPAEMRCPGCELCDPDPTSEGGE